MQLKSIQFYYVPTQLSFLKHTHPILCPAPRIGGNGDIDKGVQELDADVVEGTKNTIHSGGLIVNIGAFLFAPIDP